MDYGMIGKIEKAKRYAAEPERITFNSFSLEFIGMNNTYQVNYDHETGFTCTCPGFGSHGLCPHVMALEKLFEPMLKRAPMPYGAGQNIVSDVEKAHKYVDEAKDRITFHTFDVTFEGTNNQHHVTYGPVGWDSTSDFFKSRGVCSHTMAMERILAGMLPQPVGLVD